MIDIINSTELSNLCKLNDFTYDNANNNNKINVCCSQIKKTVH